MTLNSLMRLSGSTALAALLAATLLPLDGFAAESSDRGGHGQWSQRGGNSGPVANAPSARAPSVNWGNGDVRVPQAPPRGDFRPRQIERVNPPASQVPAPNWSQRGSDNRPARMGNGAGDNDRHGNRGGGSGGWQGGPVMGSNDGPRGNGGDRPRDGSRGHGSWQGGTVVTPDNGPRGNDRQRDGDRPGWKSDRNRSYSDPDRNRSYSDRDHDRNRDGYRDASRNWHHDRDRDHDRDRWRHYERDGHRYSYRNWNDGWRQDNRYNWYNYRQSYGDIYRMGRYHSPYRHHSYSRLGIGVYLDSMFFGSSYWIDDPWRYRLPAAYGPYRWVRYYDDALLVDVYSGEVVDVVYDFFW